MRRVATLGVLALGCVLLVAAGGPGVTEVAVTGQRSATVAAVEERPAAATIVADTVFRHGQHTSLSCLDCHSMQLGHGELLVRSTADCRNCHHGAEQRAARSCLSCHRPVDLAEVVFPQTRTMTFAVLSEPREATLPFRHADHEAQDCASCHETGDPSLAPTDLDCSSCHQEHHDAQVGGCSSCHLLPRPEAHPIEVHAGCSASGCHTEGPFEVAPRTRTACLWCHEEQRDHEPDMDCASCHRLGPSDAIAEGVFPTSVHGDSTDRTLAHRDLRSIASHLPPSTVP